MFAKYYESVASRHCGCIESSPLKEVFLCDCLHNICCARIGQQGLDARFGLMQLILVNLVLYELMYNIILL